MADIELVIKVPEELYRAYKDRPPMLGDAGMDMIAQAIANGTPLVVQACKTLEQINVLDKITVELKSVKEKWWYGVDNDCFMKLSDVLQIINKYKAESEVE